MSRLWSVDMNGGTPTPLTDESLLIFNYDAAKNGDFVVVSAFNEKNGLDLWRVEREGGNATLLLQCGADRCSVPAISPDGKFIAYVRETAAPTADLSFGSPRIWILNLETREDAPLYEDQQIIGYGPEWSPDGTRLASYDGIKDELRLLDFITNEQLIIPTQIGTPITWSPDGESIVYTDMAVNEFGIHTRIHQATITVNEISTLVGDTDEWDYAYTSLAWSPVENKLVIGLRPYADDPSMALLLMDPVFLDGEAIASEPDRIYLNPSWDLWGRALLFQQFQLFGIHKPEIVFWMPGFDQPQALAEGIMPQWLP
jgi:Tol biopolymer transport system component